MPQYRRGGVLELVVDGTRYDAKGTFTYSIGNFMREAVIGADGVHGYRETPQVSYIEGAVTDSLQLNLEQLTNATDITALLKLSNGKSIVITQGWFSGDGTASTDEGEIAVRIEGVRGEEIK